MRRIEILVEGIDRLESGVWVTRLSGRRVGQNGGPRTCEVRAGGIDEFLGGLGDYLRGMQPLDETEPAKKGRSNA